MLKLEKSVSQTTWIKGHRTLFGEEANAEFNKIGEDALIGLDEAGARVCFNFLFEDANHEKCLGKKKTTSYLMLS